MLGKFSYLSFVFSLFLCSFQVSAQVSLGAIAQFENELTPTNSVSAKISNLSKEETALLFFAKIYKDRNRSAQLSVQKAFEWLATNNDAFALLVADAFGVPTSEMHTLQVVTGQRDFEERLEGRYNYFRSSQLDKFLKALLAYKQARPGKYDEILRQIVRHLNNISSPGERWAAFSFNDYMALRALALDLQMNDSELATARDNVIKGGHFPEGVKLLGTGFKFDELPAKLRAERLLQLGDLKPEARSAALADLGIESEDALKTAAAGARNDLVVQETGRIDAAVAHQIKADSHYKLYYESVGRRAKMRRQVEAYRLSQMAGQSQIPAEMIETAQEDFSAFMIWFREIADNGKAPAEFLEIWKNHWTQEQVSNFWGERWRTNGHALMDAYQSYVSDVLYSPNSTPEMRELALSVCFQFRKGVGYDPTLWFLYIASDYFTGRDSWRFRDRTNYDREALKKVRAEYRRRLKEDPRFARSVYFRLDQGYDGVIALLASDDEPRLALGWNEGNNNRPVALREVADRHLELTVGALSQMTQKIVDADGRARGSNFNDLELFKELVLSLGDLHGFPDAVKSVFRSERVGKHFGAGENLRAAEWFGEFVGAGFAMKYETDTYSIGNVVEATRMHSNPAVADAFWRGIARGLEFQNTVRKVFNPLHQHVQDTPALIAQFQGEDLKHAFGMTSHLGMWRASPFWNLVGRKIDDTSIPLPSATVRDEIAPVLRSYFNVQYEGLDERGQTIQDYRVGVLNAFIRMGIVTGVTTMGDPDRVRAIEALRAQCAAKK